MNKRILLTLGLLAFSAPESGQAFDSHVWADRMASEDEAVRNSALADLKTLQGTEREQAISILSSVLHRGPLQAERAALGLAQLKVDAEPVLIDLIYALSYDEESVALAVSSAIVPLGGRAVGPLRRVLDDANFFTRRRAVDILGRIGPAAAPAVTPLIETLFDTQYEVQNAAEKTLIAIGPAAIPGIMSTFPKANEVQRRRLVQIMGHYGAPAADSFITIARKDASPYVRLNAMDQLGQIQPLPKEALPVLLKALSDFDESVRGGVADILGSLGPVAKPLAPTLQRIAGDDPDSLVRQKATDALTVITSTETLKK